MVGIWIYNCAIMTDYFRLSAWVVILRIISEKSYSFCIISFEHAGTKFLKSSYERYIVSKFYRVGNYAINLENVNYIERIAFKKEEPKLEIHFVGTDKVVSIEERTPEGKALLNWWENMVSALSDGTEDGAYALVNG